MQLQNSINIILFMPVQLNALIGLHSLLPMCCIGDCIDLCSPLICRNDYYLVCNLYECIRIFRGRISLVKDPSVLPHINCGPSACLLSCRNHKGGPERKYKFRPRPRNTHHSSTTSCVRGSTLGNLFLEQEMRDLSCPLPAVPAQVTMKKVPMTTREPLPVSRLDRDLCVYAIESLSPLRASA